MNQEHQHTGSLTLKPGYLGEKFGERRVEMFCIKYTYKNLTCFGPLGFFKKAQLPQF